MQDTIALWCDETLSAEEKKASANLEASKVLNDKDKGAEFEANLDVLAAAVQTGGLSLFDVSQADSSEELTSMIVGMLMKSDTRVMSLKTKLMLAVKYRRPDAVSRLLECMGIELAKSATAKIITDDPRPLQYAAYHSEFGIFGTLRGHGLDGNSPIDPSEPSHLDSLILAEIQTGFLVHQIKLQLGKNGKCTVKYREDSWLDRDEADRPAEDRVDINVNDGSKPPIWWADQKMETGSCEHSWGAKSPAERTDSVLAYYSQISWRAIYQLNSGFHGHLDEVGLMLELGPTHFDLDALTEHARIAGGDRPQKSASQLHHHASMPLAAPCSSSR